MSASDHYICPLLQNEKEETLTTNVWIEIVSVSLIVDQMFFDIISSQLVYHVFSAYVFD